MKKGEKRDIEAMEKLKLNIFKPFHSTCQFLNCHFNFVQDPTKYVADLIFSDYICVLDTCICYHF